MFNLFKKKQQGETVTLKLSGLHCTSCSLNIDSEIEELSGVFSINTSYAQQTSVINFDPKLVSPDKFKKIIEELGYKVV